MPAHVDLSQTFDTAAAAYERMRPGYPDALYQTIFDYIRPDASAQAVEIGSGSGQATLPFLQTGCSLTAVEPGVRLSAICREKFRAYPNFFVITGKFEQVDFPAQEYSLVYSASAFHWIPEGTGYTKVFAMLKSGGAFARFANHPGRSKHNPQLAEEMDRIYAEYYYPYYQKAPAPPEDYTEEQAAARADIAAKYGFADLRYALFYRTRTFSATEYCALLGTYSDHIAMAEPIRSEFFAHIADAINRHGGVITLCDTIDLQLARKP